MAKNLLFFLSLLNLGRMAELLWPSGIFPTQLPFPGTYNFSSNINPYAYSTSTSPTSTRSTLSMYVPIMVKENKTWEEALQYCRTYHTYLACPTSDTQLLLDETMAAQSQTASVWMGLHFLDGKWIWVNGNFVESQVSLPSCPVQDYRCGARDTRNKLWENTNCYKKLNFICY